MEYRFIAGLVLVLFLIVIVLSFNTFYSSTRPQKFVSNNTPADLGMFYEAVKITTSDNLKLDAWLIPAKNQTEETVIVLHGYPYDKGNILPSVAFLHEKFNLLLFDFRYLGRSEGKFTSIGWHERKDMIAAADYLRSIGQEKIYALGFSLGGAVSIMASSEAGIDKLIADSSYANLNLLLNDEFSKYGLFRTPFVEATKLMAKIMIKADVNRISPEEALSTLDIPVMIMHGTEDKQISLEHAHRLKQANPNVNLWVVEGAGHVLANEKAAGYEERVMNFFSS